jgi:hypothetical protein
MIAKQDSRKVAIDFQSSAAPPSDPRHCFVDHNGNKQATSHILVTIRLVQIVTHLSGYTNSNAILIPDDEGTDIV